MSKRRMQGLAREIIGIILASMVSVLGHCGGRTRGPRSGCWVCRSCAQAQMMARLPRCGPTWLIATTACSTATCVWMVTSPRNDGAHSCLMHQRLRGAPGCSAVPPRPPAGAAERAGLAVAESSRGAGIVLNALVTDKPKAAALPGGACIESSVPLGRPRLPAGVCPGLWARLMERGQALRSWQPFDCAQLGHHGAARLPSRLQRSRLRPRSEIRAG